MTDSARKYVPWAAKAQAWNDIESRYLDDWGENYRNMIELIRHIRNSGLSKRLYGSTSMDKLVVSIYDPLDYRKEALHIIFDVVSNRWHFEYFAMPFQDAEFSRTYDAEKGIEKFDNFINMIKW